ncbi:MAG: GDSL-type esterase/lipase family protein [Deinococcota bacterium]|nr:GDSL-type esterase/lipase family protein [Deinococcota bacterium]
MLTLLCLLVLLAACNRNAPPVDEDELAGLASRVVSFSLIDAETGQPLAGYDPLKDAAVLDLAALPTRKLTIRANTDPQTVGSVRFGLNGAYKTANVAPYLLAGERVAGERVGDRQPWTPAVGDYRLTATPYTRPDTVGTLGTALSIAFRVSDPARAPEPQPHGVTFPFDDPAVFYSPYNWRDGGGFAESNTPGAYLKAGFSGASLKLNVDVSQLAGEAAGNYPSLRAVIDGVASDHSLGAGQTQVTLASGLSGGDHSLELHFVNVRDRVDRWFTPKNALRIGGFELASGARLSPAPLRPKRLLVFGDSITEGRLIGDDETHDATLTYIQGTAADLDAEVSIVAFGGQGYRAGGIGNVPAFSVASSHYLAQSDLSLLPQPDYILIAHGRNDLKESDRVIAGEVKATLDRLRSMAPEAALLVMVPFAGTKRAAITGGFEGYQTSADAKAYLIDLGSEGEAILASHSHDGTHPDETGHRLLAGALTAAIRASISAPARAFNSLAWTERKASPRGVTEAQGAVVDGRLYVFGGYTSWFPFCTTTEARVYDPADDTWTRLAAMPEPWSHGGTAVDGRTIYLAGSYLNEPNCTLAEVATTTVYSYDVGGDRWHDDLPPLPQPRGSGGFVRLGRNLHFFGGTDTARVDKGDHWVLSLDDPTAWTAAAPLPNPRSHMGATVLNGKIYAVGGQHSYEEKASMQRSVHVYDPTSDLWTELAPLPAPLSHTSASTFVLDGRIVVAGGERSHDKPVAEVLAYDPAKDEWRALSPLPAERRAGVAGVVGGKVVYSGGHNFSAQTYLATPAE